MTNNSTMHETVPAKESSSSSTGDIWGRWLCLFVAHEMFGETKPEKLVALLQQIHIMVADPRAKKILIV